MPTRLPGPNGMCPVLLVSPATRHSFDECHEPQNNLLWFRIAWNQRFLILTWFYRKEVKTVSQTIRLNKIRIKFAWLWASGKHFKTQEPNKQTVSGIVLHEDLESSELKKKTSMTTKKNINTYQWTPSIHKEWFLSLYWFYLFPIADYRYRSTCLCSIRYAQCSVVRGSCGCCLSHCIVRNF